MCASALDASRRQTDSKSRKEMGLRTATDSSRMIVFPPKSTMSKGAEYSLVDLTDSTRAALMIVPAGRGTFDEQAREVLGSLQSVLEKQAQRMVVTAQTVFLADAAHQEKCERLLAEHFGLNLPVTNYVMQPPCCGAALALEAWAIGGESVRVERFGREVLAVSYDHVRWIYCAGVRPAESVRGCYAQTKDALEKMRAGLVKAGSSFEHVVRTWFYLGDITGPEGNDQRYHELNRARTDFYQDIGFYRTLLNSHANKCVYPASTGIGMSGQDLVMSCMALETKRDDVQLIALENPQQTPAYAYQPKYSPKSPKFSRAMALVLGGYVTTWISGTASIVDSETRYVGDVEKQTEQTIDNIERLIAPENFGRHGVSGAGANLNDLAKIRVYIKRAEDFAKCKAVCERRFGAVPAIYAVAGVCRPELLVEIEGVAFSRLQSPRVSTARNGEERPIEGK